MINTEDIIKQAEKFYEIAQNSIGAEYNGGWYVGSNNLTLEELFKVLAPKDVVTATVNLSLCCELLLKSMLNQGIVIKGHNLKDLFSKLDSKWKTFVIKKMEYENEEADFYSSLDEIALCFEKWRYIYEVKEEDRKIQFAFLHDFSIILMVTAHAKYYYENQSFDKIKQVDLDLINSIN